MYSRLIYAAIGLGLLPILASTAFGQDPEHFRGTIQSTVGHTLVINARNGANLSFAIPKEAFIFTSAVVSMSAVQSGKFIGTTTVGLPNGDLKALEIHVFAEVDRGMGEGHYPWTLLSTSETMMTNANIASMVTSVDGDVLTLEYKDGTQKVVMPAGIPVVQLTRVFHWGPLDIGSHVWVMAAKGDDGGYSAIALVVGLNGTVPPM